MSETKQSIGAWKSQTKKGEVINFTINGQRYSMWVNPYKKEDKHPDFNIYENNYTPSEKEDWKEKESKEQFSDDLPF